MVSLNIHDASTPRVALTNSTTGQTFPAGFELLVSGSDAYVSQRENANLIFSTNNTERLRVDNSGNVGIGTSSPSYKLEVAGDASFLGQDVLIDSQSGYKELRHTQTGENFAISSPESLYFIMDSREDGKVGIGTNSPNTGVTVATSANISQVAITSSAGSVAWNATAAANAYYATTENTTFAAPTNAVEGAIISVEIAQGATAYTVAWNTVFEFAASTAPTVTATANKKLEEYKT
jgi:hypothetical protein